MNALKIAIIDDDHVDRLISKKLIERISPSVDTIEFDNALDALQYFSDNASKAEILPDVVLLDIRMPFMSGWEYLDHYSMMAPDIIKQPRHYIYTSSIDPEDLNCRHNHVYGHYTKPFDTESLSRILETERNIMCPPDNSPIL